MSLASKTGDCDRSTERAIKVSAKFLDLMICSMSVCQECRSQQLFFIDPHTNTRRCQGCSQPPNQCCCFPTVFDRASGDTICSGCGLILDSYYLDESPEWNEDMSRCALPCSIEMRMPVNYPEEMIGNTKILNNKTLKPSKLMTQLNAGLTEKSGPDVSRLLEVAAQMKIPAHVTQSAQTFLQDLAACRASKGHIAEGIRACSLYYACLTNTGTARQRKEICEAFKIEESLFYRADSIFKEALQTKPYFKQMFQTADEYSGLIIRSVQHLAIADQQLCQKVKSTAMKMADAVSRKNISGKSVRALTCGILFLSCQRCGFKVSKRDLAKQTDLATVPTLTDAVKVLTVHGA